MPYYIASTVFWLEPKDTYNRDYLWRKYRKDVPFRNRISVYTCEDKYGKVYAIFVYKEAE